MPPEDSDVQDKITTFWSAVAPDYDSYAGNVPELDSAEYAAWTRALERLLPAQPADVLDIGTGTGFLALIASQLGYRVTALDLSTTMLAEARAHADRRGLKSTFLRGDAVKPPLDAGTFDAIVCRHLLWTLRESRAALVNWRRLLRSSGRVVVIDAFWSDQAVLDDGASLFGRHYTSRIRDALPAMRWESVEPLTELLARAGFSEVTVGDLADVHRLAKNPPSTRPWYVVTGRRR